MVHSCVNWVVVKRQTGAERVKSRADGEPHPLRNAGYFREDKNVSCWWDKIENMCTYWYCSTIDELLRNHVQRFTFSYYSEFTTTTATTTVRVQDNHIRIHICNAVSSTYCYWCVLIVHRRSILHLYWPRGSNPRTQTDCRYCSYSSMRVLESTLSMWSNWLPLLPVVTFTACSYLYYL